MKADDVTGLRREFESLVWRLVERNRFKARCLEGLRQKCRNLVALESTKPRPDDYGPRRVALLTELRDMASYRPSPDLMPDPEIDPTLALEAMQAAHKALMGSLHSLTSAGVTACRLLELALASADDRMPGDDIPGR